MQLARIAERDGWWCWLCGEAIEPSAIGPWCPIPDVSAALFDISTGRTRS